MDPSSKTCMDPSVNVPNLVTEGEAKAAKSAIGRRWCQTYCCWLSLSD